jgi:hypothetical protein
MTSAVVPESSKQTLSGRAWLLIVLLTTAAVVAMNLAVAWKTDPFGVLRDPQGRVLMTSNYRHNSERTSKYLLNFHYVPENFDALVTGTSQQAALRLNGLSPYRFYNEGIFRGDGSEERLLVDKALETGHFKLALVGISFGLTERHDLQDALDQATPQQALGSLYFYQSLLDLKFGMRGKVGAHFPDGSWMFPQIKRDPNAPESHGAPPPIDLKAAADYRKMIENLESRHVKVIYFISPHGHMDHPYTRGIIDGYRNWFLSYMPPAPIIDLNEPEYAAYARNPDLMIDEDHLSEEGSRIYSRLVMARVQQIVQGR